MAQRSYSVLDRLLALISVQFRGVTLRLCIHAAGPKTYSWVRNLKKISLLLKGLLLEM